jgi:hypothetical protein
VQHRLYAVWARAAQLGRCSCITRMLWFPGNMLVEGGLSVTPHFTTTYDHTQYQSAYHQPCCCQCYVFKCCRRLILGEATPLPVMLSLVPIMFGVGLASAGELSFNWTGFISAMLSNLTFGFRAVWGKA